MQPCRNVPVNNPDGMGREAVSNSMGIGGMLLRWKRSVYKVAIKEMTVFFVLFAIISAVYRALLNEQQKKTFEEAKSFCKSFTELISLPFILGFYITIVANRWWHQYMAVPWPDRLMLTIQMYIPGEDEERKLLRRGLARRALLMLTLLLRSISRSVRHTYPTLQDLVTEGMMTRSEKVAFESLAPVVNLYWVPATWFVSALSEAADCGFLANPSGIKLIMEEFLDFRAQCGALWSFNWTNLPMIYTQVCTLCTYSFFCACLVARQYTGPGSSVMSIDTYFPVWTILEILFYVGMLKVAAEMNNPFGDDDEDFDLRFLLSRHYKTIHLGMHYLDDVFPH